MLQIFAQKSSRVSEIMIKILENCYGYLKISLETLGNRHESAPKENDRSFPSFCFLFFNLSLSLSHAHTQWNSDSFAMVSNNTLGWVCNSKSRFHQLSLKGKLTTINISVLFVVDFC